MKSKNTKTSVKGKGLTADELAAMKETLKERKMGKEEGESALLAAIAKMAEPDRTMARRLHAIVTAAAPSLTPKTWYGMPAYADKNGKAVCFFQNAGKFKARYATFGFNYNARLDEGDMWATSFALKKLTATEEAKIKALVKKAVS